jgi:predicted nucleotidyltransferase
MDKSTIIATLREHEAELRSVGIERLYLFGSYARGTAVQAVSDVDLLAEFDKSQRLTLVSLGSLESRLSDLLGVRVDLSSGDWMREPVREQAIREAVLAF